MRRPVMTWTGDRCVTNHPGKHSLSSLRG